MMRKAWWWIGLALLVLTGGSLGYYWYRRPDSPLTAVDPPERPALQGLNGAERERFYHLSMGSELLPLAWLKALHSERTGKPFLEDIDRFGLLADPGHPDGLPIGLTAAPTRDARFVGKMVGLNCAACHTGEMTCQGKSIRLDGAPGLFFGEAFVKDLLESLEATVQSPAKLVAFLRRTFQDRDHADALADKRPGAQKLFSTLASLEALPHLGALEKRLAEHLERIHKIELERAAPILENGLGSTWNRQAWLGDLDHGDLKELLGRESGPQSPFAAAETRASHLRQTLDHFVETIRLLKARGAFARKLLAEKNLQLPMTVGGPGRVDDFGAARNLLFDVKDARPITAPCSIPHLWGTGALRWSDWDNNTRSTQGRSLATALAVGAVFDPKSYRSTVMPRHLAELDRLAEKLTAPVWPTKVFGGIDHDKAERGAVLYQKHCVKCHVDARQRPAGLAADADWPPEILISYKEVGTDPQRAENFAAPLGQRPFDEAVREMIDRYLERANRDAGIDADEARKLESGHPNVWRTTRKYAARPLVSVWATAPYLHNGSVPTLYDLLLPADQRPRTFPLGHREYDPVRLGYTTEVAVEPLFLFDTTLTGNRNTGHEYATDLPEIQRLELLEYLKGI